ncbi:MAG TPA: Clp protease N-terminal domain-containing protein [Blastocatellia bacterium]|nr:Clp protease N-terminal domain-containing protein [Blastocatellia bacterium]
MFERYTEKARRVIFFARYEASQLGARAIEAEHILLGLLREDKQLTQKFLGNARSTIESIRTEIEGRNPPGDEIPTSVDLPLSATAKLVLTHAAEESDRLGHRHIGTEHLLLGILREEKSAACEILYERGLKLGVVREDMIAAQARRSEIPIERTPDLETQFSRLLDILSRKSLIDENERRQITSE